MSFFIFCLLSITSRQLGAGPVMHTCNECNLALCFPIANQIEEGLTREKEKKKTHKLLRTDNNPYILIPTK